ncbi:MAG: 2-hydroxyacyl-CoA dehydratase [Planctomycetota bacterium]
MADGDYTAMWRELGIDLAAHDGLLEVLGQACGDIFLSQANRPEGMKYLDFVLSEIHGLRIQELLEAKAEGRPVVGTFCLYVPEEIILAAGGVSVALLINQVAFYDAPERFTEKIHALCEELDARVEAGEGVAPADAPRILISGCPMAAPNWKVPAVVEKLGAVIVGEESCVGERGTRNQVSDDGTTREELLDAIAERYLAIDCACFTPNDERMDHIAQMARDLDADGVVHYALLFCTPYLVEAQRVRERCKAEGLALLAVETDYAREDMGQLETRVGAFLELLGG